MKPRLGITPKLTLIFVGFAALLLAGVASLAYLNGQNALRQAAISELQSIANEKDSALIEWEQDKQTEVQTLASLAELQQALAAFRSAQADLPEVRAAHNQLIDLLRPWAGDDKEFLGLLVMNPDTAEVIAATRADEEGKFKETFPYFIHGRESPYLQSAYYSPALQDVAMTVSAPIKAPDGQLLGVLAGRLNLDQLNAIIQRRSGLHQTDDAFLISASNLFVTQPRFISDPAVLRRGIHTEAVKRCLLHEAGALAYPDYRGEPVIGVYRWLPEFDVCLIVKLDQAEAFEPSLAFGQTILILSLATLAVALVLAIGLARTIVRPLRSLQSGVVRFGQGELDARLPETSKDELGVLAREFNQMAVSLAEKDAQLREYATQLEQKVDERTAQLRQSEERFSKAFSASPIGLSLTRLADGSFTDVNESFLHLFGYSREEVIGRTAIELKMYSSPEEWAELVWRLREQGSIRDFEMTTRAKSGEAIHVLFSIEMIELNGEVHALATIVDITARKQAEEELIKSEEKYRYLFKNNPQPMWVYDVKTLAFLDVNDVAIAKYGYSRQEFLHMTLFDIRPSEEAQRLMENLAQPRQTLEASEGWKHRLKDGKIIQVEIHSHTIKTGDRESVLVIAQDITERKQAEQALHDSEERYRIIFELTNDYAYEDRVELDGHIVPEWITSGVTRITGYTVDEMNAPDFWLRLVHPDDMPIMIQHAQRILAGQAGIAEMRIITKTGGVRWLKDSAYPIWDAAQGRVLRLYGAAIDITESKQVEEKLRENEERYSRFFENMHEIFVIQEIIVDHDGTPIDLRFIDVNPAAERFLGKTRSEIVGRTRSELSGRPDAEGVEMASRVASTGTPFHMIRYSAGFGSWFESFTYSLGSGIVATLSLNITERKEAEAALERMNEELEIQVQERTAALSQANTLLQMLLDQMPDHIYFKDTQSRFIRNSRSQAKALGLSNPAEVVGKSDFDFFPHAQLSYEKEQEIIRSGKPLIDQEERVVWPDGSETWVSTTKMPLFDQAGEIIGTFGISRDITDRKQAEIALQKAKLELEAANKELEAFSYSVSHDLRAPLRSIDGFSQALLEDYGETLPPDGHNFLERIRSSAQRMAELIDDLLNLSKVTRAFMKLVPVDLSQLAQGIVAELQRTHRERRVNFNITPNLKARGDPNLLQIVLENLLNNAWKFTSKREQAEIEFGSKYENDETVYFVRDNGAGFDMTYVGKLFGAFQRLHAMTEFSGTGIGLATVQRIINRHGGRIWAEGAVDQGATFFFTLPALERARPQPEPTEMDSLDQRVREII